jgi:hypothetical protein
VGEILAATFERTRSYDRAGEIRPSRQIFDGPSPGGQIDTGVHPMTCLRLREGAILLARERLQDHAILADLPAFGTNNRVLKSKGSSTPKTPFVQQVTRGRYYFVRYTSLRIGRYRRLLRPQEPSRVVGSLEW